ncbi:cytochrome b/b6 domain-containing protein [Sporomusa termitida]|uniref:CytB-hydogenase: Ni/Fe-hydrogenase, b-type cytochrome subunit n=1 Tax=Sporomusa termitida TaxID=2377 RepID=A0A517E159_9FIRM|nr:cytochrome b/b6 domain-containing protein [Sporomusa termitida]QDR83318.1 CytB-hydogenase: Ni/Fe-hydrogenase, b-type cytochrome subunit [Sporomusa termitida]
MKLLLHPLAIRIFHWILVLSVTYLVITGLYLHDPKGNLPFGLLRKTHTLVGMMLIINLLGQIYYYSITGKYTEVLFTRRDIPNLRSFFRYTLFITANHPNYGRYNPGQKGLFTIWVLAIMLSGLAALPHLLPEYASWLSRPLGGLMGTRVIFYAITMLFLATIPLHVYLVFTEDPAKLQAMFSGYLRQEPKDKAPASERTDSR